jgi:hypothetical protein
MILLGMLFTSLPVCAVDLDLRAAHFREFVGKRILCMNTAGVVGYGELLKNTAESAGFEVIEFSGKKKEGPEFDDYEVLLKRKTGEIKALGFEILAVYSDPADRQIFSALLRANRDDIMNAIEKNGIKMKQVLLNQFTTPLIEGGHPPPWVIEIEDCNKGGKNKNIPNICKQFDKPATWIGCVYELDKIYLEAMIEKMNRKE